MWKRVLLLFGVLAAADAAAQGSQGQACYARNVTHDQRIADCTAVIDARQEKGRRQYFPQWNGCFALTEKRDLDRALADLE